MHYVITSLSQHGQILEKSVRKEGFNVKGALEYATGSGALTEEKLDEDRVYYPANEDMWVWLN
jgi:hypothetical protein